jgi:26S proteasome regulatory subunit N8
MRLYLQNVLSGKFRYNHAIIHNFQDIFNLLPNLKVDSVVKNFSVKTNDYMHVVYVSTLIRSVISLHNLINNKIATKEIEVENSKKEEEFRRADNERMRKFLNAPKMQTLPTGRPFKPSDQSMGTLG